MKRVEGTGRREGKIKAGGRSNRSERWKRPDHLMIEKKSASRSYFVERRFV